MQVLLLQDRIDLSDQVRFLIESTFSAQVQTVPMISEGLKVVQNSQSLLDLIIVDLKQGVSGELEEFMAQAPGVAVLLCVSGGGVKGVPSPARVVGLIERTTFMESMTHAIQSLIDQGILKSNSVDLKDSPGQVRIAAKLLLSVGPLNGDIYIRLSESKFVKLFRKGDVFDLNDLEKYSIKKGVNYLYIRQEQCQEFAQKYKVELDKIFKSDRLNIEDMSLLNMSVQETVQELIRKVGFSKEVQEITRTQVQLTVKSMGKDPDLADILKKLKATEGQYISSHSTLCAYFSCAIAGQLQWGSDTTFTKLSLAAFLHDITLNNHDLAQLTSLDELERYETKFTAEEIKQFKNHPVEAAELAKRMTEVPADVDTIIRQHHEKADGKGFPRSLSHQYIAPLAVVFIIAHDLTQYTIRAGADFNASVFLGEVREKYKSNQFKKVLGCIEILTKIKELAMSMKKG